MADIVFNGNGPKPICARVWDVQKEFTSDSPPGAQQLRAILEADIEGGGHAYAKLTLNPGKFGSWGCPESNFYRLFDQENLMEATETFLNTYAPVDELEDLFLC